MIHWKEEATEIKQDLNLYPLNCKHSVGGVLRIGNHAFRIRWSKNAKRFFGGYSKIDSFTLSDWETKNGYSK